MAAAEQSRQRRLWRGGRALAALPPLLLSLAFAGAALADPPAAEGLKVSVEQAHFRFEQPDGELLPLERIIGAKLVVSTEDGTRRRLRIDAARPDPADRRGEVVLYDFSVEQPGDGSWQPLCEPDPEGRRSGFPIASADAPGGGTRAGGFFVTCTGGAYGKCIRFGYRPWLGEEGPALYRTCVRMVRADYCGDDVGHTRNGTPINIWDRRGIQQRDEVPGMRFEAGWGPEGAVCINKSRLADGPGAEAIRAACPRLAAAGSGGPCDEAAATGGGALLFNESY